MCYVTFMYMYIPNIYYWIYYDVHYLYLLIAISQDEIMLAAAVRGLVDIVKEAIEKEANVNNQHLDEVSYT